MGWHWSPFVVPLGAFLIAIVAIISNGLGEANKQRLRAEQRMAMVARGMSADEIDKLLAKGNDAKDPLRSLAAARRTAIVLISTGTGLILFFLLLTWIVNEHNVLAGAAAGLIPLTIGAGFLIDYHLQKRELSRFGLEVGQEE